MEQMKPQLAIVARVDRKALEDSDRVLRLGPSPRHEGAFIRRL